MKIRDICNSSIEEKRIKKEIGSSLEAELKINLNNKYKNIIKNIDFSELCIISKAEITLNENEDITVITSRAKGNKCPICWKISVDPCKRHQCALNDK